MRVLDRGRRGQRGLALVEFALVIPLVALLLFATAEIGRATFQYNTLTKAVRDGARYLANQGSGTTGVLQVDAADIAAARNLVVFGNIAGAGEPLLPGWSTDQVTAGIEDARHVRVDATYDFQPVLVPIPTFGFGDGEGISIGSFSSDAVMRSLQQ